MPDSSEVSIALGAKEPLGMQESIMFPPNLRDGGGQPAQVILCGCIRALSSAMERRRHTKHQTSTLGGVDRSSPLRQAIAV